MSSIYTILHPTDMSDCARYAFRLAGMLAREQGARLVILHVNPTMGPMVACREVLAELEPDGSREKLLELLHRLQVADPKVRVEYRLVDGEGVPEILEQAAEIKADLIVAPNGTVVHYPQNGVPGDGDDGQVHGFRQFPH